MMQLNSNQIAEIIPHRYPFALVDRIVDQAPAKRCAADVPGESVAATTSGSVLSSAMFARFASSSREERSKGGSAMRL